MVDGRSEKKIGYKFWFKRLLFGGALGTVSAKMLARSTLLTCEGTPQPHRLVSACLRVDPMLTPWDTSRHRRDTAGHLWDTGGTWRDIYLRDTGGTCRDTGGTYRDIPGHTGTYRDIRDILRTYREIPGHTGTYRDIPGHLWDTCGTRVGHVWECGTRRDIGGTRRDTFGTCVGHAGTPAGHAETLCRHVD